MDIVGLGKRVQIFVDEGDSAQGRPLYLTLLEKLRAEGAAGATVARGVAGFGAHSHLHDDGLADRTSASPLTITWIDAPERVERLMPIVTAVAGEHLITVEDVQIVRYPHRDLSSLRTKLVVSELMTSEVVAVRRDAALWKVLDLLIDRDFRAIPVTDEDDRLVGIITNSDLVERGQLPARIELLAGMESGVRGQAISSTRGRHAEEVMTADPVSIHPDEPLEQAIELMISRRLKRLPVVDDSTRLIGMISRADLLRALGESYPAPADDEPGLPGAPAAVGEIMDRHVPVVRHDARLAEVLDVVISTRLNHAVVIDADGRVQGMINDADVLDRLDPHAQTGLVGALMGHDRAVPEQAARVTAADIMRAPAVTATADTPVAEVARRMLEARHKVMPIVDDRGVLLGIVDRAHLLAAMRASH